MLDAINFCLQGSLIDLINRQIPNFNRTSPVWMEKEINGATQLHSIDAHHPAIYPDDGSFLLEPSRTNRLTWSRDFSQNVWVKGSGVVLFPDAVLSADGSYQADKIAFTGGTGETVTVKRSLTLKSNTDHVFSILIRQEESSISKDSDIIKFTGDVVGSPQIKISALNNSPGKYRVLELKFKTSNTPIINNSPYTSNVSLEIYIESIIVLNIAFTQIEESEFRTSFIPTNESMITREGGQLIYRKNPISGARNCGIFVDIKEWRGNGNIINAGNISLEIINNQLVCKANNTTYQHPTPLPSAFKVFVQVSEDTLDIQFYIDGFLVDKKPINSFVGSSNHLNLTTNGVRRIGLVIVTNKTLINTEQTIGELANKEIYELFNAPDPIDSFVLSAEPPIVNLPEVTIPANTPPEYIYTKASVRFPFTPSAKEEITNINSPLKRLSVNSVTSFILGKAYIHTFLYEDVSEVTITAIDQENGFLFLNNVNNISNGDYIAQPKDEMIISPANYSVGFLNPNTGAEVERKYTNGIAIKNPTSNPIKCSPYIKVYL